MDITILESIVQSQTVWAILCLIVVVFFYRKREEESNRLRVQADEREKRIQKLYENHKQESKIREDKLMNHLEKTTDTMQNIQKGLTRLENRIDGGFQEIWDQIDSLKKGEYNK